MGKPGKLQLLFLVGASLAAVACMPLEVKEQPGATSASGGGGSSSVGGGGGAGMSSVAAFTATVFPLVTAHCADCHTSTNQPFFAGGNAQTDHDTIVSNSEVNLSNPAASNFVSRLSQDMHNCWSDCASNANTMQAAIAQWATLMQASSSGSGSGGASGGSTATSTTTTTTTTAAARMNTIEMLVPATLPGPGTAAANFTTLTWTLASSADTITPDITGASFSVDIQQFDQFSYELKNPRITTPSSAVYIEDIRVAINGTIRANDVTYSLVDQVAPMSATAAVLSPAAMIMQIDKGKGVDQLAISFAQISLSASGGCKNLAGWQSAVKPVMQTTCVRCHAPGNIFDMVTAPDSAICARTLGRVSLTFPSNSPLIVLPTTGTNHPGGGNLINQTTVNSWVNWINTEH